MIVANDFIGRSSDTFPIVKILVKIQLFKLYLNTNKDKLTFVSNKY